MGKEIFDNIPSKVSDLLMDVKNGRIGLPDLQRPFVWKDNKVRELLDSMIKGYPIGYIMLWSSPLEYESVTHIGKNDKVYKQPDDLVIDGQQRLTALLASMHGVKIKDKDYKERNINICYNPLTREFAVWTPAYEKNAEWISRICDVFKADEEHNVSRFRKNYIKEVNENRLKSGLYELTDDEEELIENNINDLLNLSFYSLPTLKINSKASEEEVADIFVRVNSGGQKLNEKDFIETLLAVFDNDVHKKINEFCAQSRIPKAGTSYNHILTVDSVHLIRMTVGYGFKRARLRYAYMLLRGKDLKSGEYSEETRNKNLEIFKKSLEVVTNLNNWHSFMNLFSGAGYLNSSLVASTNAVVFCYVLYLIGKYDYNVPTVTLQKIMKKWIFMSTITYFYTGSTESEVEKQFADLRNVHGPDEFVKYLDDVINTRFTDDYFNLTLPSELNSSSSISPAWFGYVASLNVLNTPMLFSTTPLAKHFVVGTSGDKNSIDKHHIFPKNYLTKIGYTEDRDRNQIANFTYLDYATNIEISDNPPIDYVSRYREKLGEEGYALACKQNALPTDFEKMEYQDFLRERRVLMADIIRQAFNELCK